MCMLKYTFWSETEMGAWSLLYLFSDNTRHKLVLYNSSMQHLVTLMTMCCGTVLYIDSCGMGSLEPLNSCQRKQATGVQWEHVALTPALWHNTTSWSAPDSMITYITFNILMYYVCKITSKCFPGFLLIFNNWFNIAVLWLL